MNSAVYLTLAADLENKFQKAVNESAHTLAMLVLQSDLYAVPEVKEEVDFIIEYRRQMTEYLDIATGRKKEVES